MGDVPIGISVRLYVPRSRMRELDLEQGLQVREFADRSLLRRYLPLVRETMRYLRAIPHFKLHSMMIFSFNARQRVESVINSLSPKFDRLEGDLPMDMDLKPIVISVSIPPQELMRVRRIAMRAIKEQVLAMLMRTIDVLSRKDPAVKEHYDLLSEGSYTWEERVDAALEAIRRTPFPVPHLRRAIAERMDYMKYGFLDPSFLAKLDEIAKNLSMEEA